MAKKKKAKGVKRGKKGAKEKQQKKKEPTEKELFEEQVSELASQLEAATLRESELRREHSSLGKRLAGEREIREACQRHLRGELGAWSERYLEARERLRTERHLEELLERRAWAKMSAARRSGEDARSRFLQKKAELEGKLSLLEELRLERASRAAHLRRTEAAEEDRSSELRHRGREEDRAQAEGLLRGRKEFVRMCGDAREEFRSAFTMRLAVRAGAQLRENVRLREECRREADALLEEQGRSRELRAACVEEEVREAAAHARGSMMKAQRVTPPPRPMIPEVITPVSPVLRQPEDESSDRIAELSAILMDQDRHQMSLQRQMQDTLDKNGRLVSCLLRAGQVLTSGRRPAELLQQVRALLDLHDKTLNVE